MSELLFDCEIIGCFQKTEYYLCYEHNSEALRDDRRIVVCRNCGCILKIEERKKGEDKFRQTNGGECLRCKPKVKEEE